VVCSACSGRRPRRVLPSFPTRRSSDLGGFGEVGGEAGGGGLFAVFFTTPAGECYQVDSIQLGHLLQCLSDLIAVHVRQAEIKERSEEHTSELQSRENLVCRLLLENKKP